MVDPARCRSGRRAGKPSRQRAARGEHNHPDGCGRFRSAGGTKYAGAGTFGSTRFVFAGWQPGRRCFVVTGWLVCKRLEDLCV